MDGKIVQTAGRDRLAEASSTDFRFADQYPQCYL